MNVTVRYSQACGLRCRAERLAAMLEKELHIPVQTQEANAAGQFDVIVGDDVVAQSSHPGFWRWILGDTGLPDEGEMLAAVRAKLER